MYILFLFSKGIQWFKLKSMIVYSLFMWHISIYEIRIKMIGSYLFYLATLNNV